MSNTYRTSFWAKIFPLSIFSTPVRFFVWINTIFQLTNFICHWFCLDKLRYITEATVNIQYFHKISLNKHSCEGKKYNKKIPYPMKALHELKAVVGVWIFFLICCESASFPVIFHWKLDYLVLAKCSAQHTLNMKCNFQRNLTSYQKKAFKEI